MLNRTHRLTTVLSLLILLYGCGGGSSGGEDIDSGNTSEFDLVRAITTGADESSTEKWNCTFVNLDSGETVGSTTLTFWDNGRGITGDGSQYSWSLIDSDKIESIYESGEREFLFEEFEFSAEEDTFTALDRSTRNPGTDDEITLLLDTSCQRFEPGSDNTLAIDTLEFTLVNVDPTNNGLSDFTISDRPLPVGGQLLFDFIPGSLAGVPRPEALIIEPVDGAGKAVVSFDSSIFRGTAIPEILNLEAANLGLSIVPANTQFGRLGTFVLDASNQIVAGGTGLFANNQGFIIAYFDRASTVSGSIQFDIESTAVSIFDINIPAEGFYAISIEVQDNLDQRWTVFDIPSDVFFFIDESF